MKSSRKPLIAAATFGAALTSIHAAPELNADIVDLTFTPGSVGWSVGQLAVSLDQVGLSFSQWNDSIGKTLSAGGLAGVGVVSFSQSLAAGTFSGTSSIGFTASQTGTVFIGFNDGAGNVGWFNLDFGGFGNSITYLGGQYGNAGETVHVGGVIPEPATAGLAALALGAIGLRRRRTA